MEIQKSKLRPYGFTLKKVKLVNVTEDTYVAHMQRLPWELYCDVAYEHEGGLHCHGVAYIPRAVSLKRFHFRGWHMKLEELYDPQQWMIYCNKHQEAPTIDMTDTPIEEDFIPPKKSMFKPPVKPVRGGEFTRAGEAQICKHKLGDDFCDEFCTDFPCI